MCEFVVMCFRINWFHNARFRAGKLYVVRQNPSMFEQGDGMSADPPFSVSGWQSWLTC
jgi:hypothetical protein